MKNFRTILAALLMLFCATLSAQNFEVDGIFYNILSEGDRTVEVTYKGSYRDEYSEEYSGNVVIPANVTYEGTTYSVTTIGESAFGFCKITSIEIPNSVTSIGYGAFYHCRNLTSIEIPNSVTKIGDEAFGYCTGLTSIEIPNSVTTIKDGTFYACYGLTSIEIPNSVTTIGDEAFNSCNSLTSIEIPNSVTTIGDYAFRNCVLTSIEIPNSVTTIGYGAFFGCGLTSIVVAEDNTIYDSREDCNAIIETATNTLILGCKNTVIPNSVTTIGNSAFYSRTGLTSIEIPNSVTTIEEDAFYNCYGLTSIEIPNSVTTIGESAFYQCSGLTSIEIPNSVTTIGNGAFGACGLTSIVVAEDNTIYDSREDCNAIIETATNTLISGCKNTIIPNSVTNIGRSAFYGCYDLTSIEIPNSVTTIEEDAFGFCKITSIEIPNSVTTIGNGAFGYCYGLTSITIPNSVTTIGNSAFSSCDGLTSITIPNSVTSIGNNAFYFCTGLTSIEIPNSVTTIGESAFCGCEGLTSITIPNSVTSIGNGAFDYCEGLTSVTSLIPADKLFSIDSSVFNRVDKNACTLYVPYGAKETYEATDGWNEFTNIVEMKGYDLTVSAAEYATLYLDFNAEIPEGVEVFTASTVDGNRLMMQEVTGILPANTGVIVRAEQGTYTFLESCEAAEAIESNLLRGSVEDVYITPSKDAKYYVLAMKDGVVGMYEDALTGGTFKNNANKAYLQLKPQLGIYDEEVDTEDPGMQLSNSYYFDFSSTTAIEPVINEVEDNIYYDLSGRRVENPVQGIYIVNGKKVLVK